MSLSYWGGGGCGCFSGGQVDWHWGMPDVAWLTTGVSTLGGHLSHSRTLPQCTNRKWEEVSLSSWAKRANSPELGVLSKFLLFSGTQSPRCEMERLPHSPPPSPSGSSSDQVGEEMGKHCTNWTPSLHNCVCVFSRVRFFAIPTDWPTRLLCPWDFPSKNTVVGCHSL